MIHCAPAEGGSNETEREAHERHYAAGRFVRVAWERQIVHGVFEDCGLVLDDKVACSSTIECVADVTSLFELDAAGRERIANRIRLRPRRDPEARTIAQGSTLLVCNLGWHLGWLAYTWLATVHLGLGAGLRV